LEALRNFWPSRRRHFSEIMLSAAANLLTKDEVRRDRSKYREAAGAVRSEGLAYATALRSSFPAPAMKDVTRDPMRKRQKEWSSGPLMCTVDRVQLHLSVPSELRAWRSAPEQQFAIQRQGKRCLSPCRRLRPLPMSRQGQRRCCDE